MSHPPKPARAAISLEQLAGALEAFSRAPDTSSIMAIVTRMARSLTGADNASFIVCENGTCHFAEEDAALPLWKGRRIAQTEYFGAEGLRPGTALMVRDLADAPQIPRAIYKDTFVKSLAIVPVGTEKCACALALYWASTYELSQKELRILQVLAYSAGIAWENALQKKPAEEAEAAAPVLPDLTQFMYSLPAFANLPAEDMDFLLRASTVKDYQKHMPVITQKGRADNLYIVLSGWVKIFSSNDNGVESGIMLLKQGDEFGADAIFEDGNYFYSARTETEAQLLAVPANALRQRAKESAAFSSMIMRNLSEEIKARQIAEACSRHPFATQRVACLLLRLTDWMKGRGGTFRMPYKKVVAATQLGMDQGTFSRALAKLAKLGVSSKEGQVTIEDFSVISEHCCARCPFAQGQCKGPRLKTDL